MVMTDAREPALAAAHPAVPERPAARHLRRLAHLRVAAAFWLLAVAALAVFLAVGSVRVEAGEDRGRSVRVVEVWWRFMDALPTVGQAALLQVVIVGAVAVVVLGSALGLWLALRPGFEPTPETGVDPPAVG